MTCPLYFGLQEVYCKYTYTIANTCIENKWTHMFAAKKTYKI
jgi:hypothetical protein